MVECRIAVNTGGASEHIVMAYAYLSRWDWSRTGLIEGSFEGNSKQSKR